MIHDFKLIAEIAIPEIKKAEPACDSAFFILSIII
jgi:hypothetical protein